MPEYMVIYSKVLFKTPVTFFTDDILAVNEIVNQCNDSMDYCEVYVRKYPVNETDEQAHYVFEYSA